MRERKEFNLCDFMPDTVSLNEHIKPTVRPMYINKPQRPWLFEEDPYKIIGETNYSAKVVSESTVGTPIQEFFRGKNFFITGGSGFLGKVLAEKLIRSVPHVGHVYLLLRPKRGKTSEERFDILLKDKLFSRMKAEVPHYLTKLRVLAGDITEPGLGLSDEDRLLLLNTVHVVFHCAADVRFLEPLRSAIVSNVLGAKHILDIAKDMKHLKVCLHVSTAYSHCVNKVVEEKVPKMSINYKEILHFVDSNTDSYIKNNLEKILQGWPNTYTFSKGLCENMIQEEAKELPICIFRPSIVMSTYKEPVRGWTDNVYGPLGMIVAGALGILHCIRLNERETSDVVPVDYTVNCMVAAAWKTSLQSKFGVEPVYNFTSSPQNVTFWKLVLRNKEPLFVWPSNQSIWYPSYFTTGSLLVDDLNHIILHKIPGIILDKMAVLTGRKPRLTKIYNVLESLKKPLEFFRIRSWQFDNENVKQLWIDLSDEDKKLFCFDVRDLDWTEYTTLSWLGFRFYYLKESMESIPAARKKQKWLLAAHIGLKVICGFVLLKVAVYAAHILPI